jgi:hypothetical protein
MLEWRDTGVGSVTEFIWLFNVQLITALYNSLSHATFVTAFTVLLGNVFQQQIFLCFWTHILEGWWPSHIKLLLLGLSTLLMLNSDWLFSVRLWMAAGPHYIRPQHRPRRCHYFKQFFHRCMCTLLSNGTGTVATLKKCCLAMDVFLALFSSNGCICWLHSYCYTQTCHSMF